ncbi:Asp-tRNA(Asn)/Glu-tRNA(Gln) amidotransferase GatCAB subunit B, partial [Candidatus Poribacteria bacterium]|nr:Asp-tRNA(Asn)/Glu-tRNA(Gln) amidotransferase GatCAB subunit B [Candidatus Poribacteria bacterium]
RIIEEQGLVQVSDTTSLDAWVTQAIEENPGPVSDFRGGKDKALGFLVGQVMKLSRGKANPQRINERLRALLSGDGA